LERDLLKLQEDELELDDECKLSIFLALLWKLEFSTVEGVRERKKFEQASGQSQKTSVQNLHLPPSSRRRRGMYHFLVYVLLLTRRPEGPAFLPSEHDELPPGVAFMVGLNLT
jgi:division protein 1